MSKAYTVVDYRLERLSEFGADRIFGVPGDFTLTMLDHIERDERVQWVTPRIDAQPNRALITEP